MIRTIFKTALLLAYTSAWANTLPISLNIYPIEAKVAYGATAQEISLQFYVVSNAPNDIVLANYQLNALNAPSPNPITVLSYTDNCNNLLPSQQRAGTCTIFVNLKAAGNPVGSSVFLEPIDYNFSFSYKSGTRTQTMTSNNFTIAFANGQAIPAASRTFEFQNNCSQDVWLGIASGAIESINPDPSIQPPDPQSCLVDTDCYAGSKCVPVAASPVVLKHCLWENPVPAGGATGYQLAPTDNTTVSFPVYDNGIDTTWNGGIAARINCTGAGASCAIADCGGSSSDGACALAQGFATPNTTAEFTLQAKQNLVTNTSGYPDVDTYDITVINGVTRGGLSMEPTNATWSPAKPYVCGTPGAATAQSPLGDCNWSTMQPPASPPLGALQADYVWVTPNGGPCPSGTGCTGTDVCGHSISGATVNPLSCGTQLGLLTADAVCAIDSSFGAPFNCAEKVTQNNVQYTYANIYGCSVGAFKNSCYSAGASSACCGCQNWADDPDYPAVIPSSTQSCNNINNTNWSVIAKPTLAWLKQACPTAYVFPYDDASSTFTCQVLNSDNVNTTNYKITFCP